MRERKSIRARAPKSSSPTVRFVMQRNTGRETHPEELLGTALNKAGFNFHRDLPPEPDLRIKADFVFPEQKICVFIDGCFWHGCPLHFKVPKTNSDWWQEKIEDNKIRDIRQSSELNNCGWIVIRYWEHDVTQNNLSTICSEIKQNIQGKTSRYDQSR